MSQELSESDRDHACFQWKLGASSNTSGLWHRRAAWLQTLKNERTLLSQGNIYNMDKSKHGGAGSRVLESQTVSFFFFNQTLQFVKDVEGEVLGISEGPWSERCSWVDTAGFHPHRNHMDPRNAPPIGQAGDLNCNGVRARFSICFHCVKMSCW